MKFIYMLNSGLHVFNNRMEFDFFSFSWKLHKNYPQLQLFIWNSPNESLNFGLTQIVSKICWFF